MLKLVRIRASYGWLEITRDSVRYDLVRQSAATKDQDRGFAAERRQVKKLRFQYGATAFEAAKTRHFVAYLGEKDWTRYDVPYAQRKWEPNPAYTQFIIVALENFDQAVESVKQYEARLRAAAVPPAPASPKPAVATPEPPKPEAPPTPPTIILVDPSVSSGQTIGTSNATLTIRGVAMDATGFPIVDINGSSANMKPRNAQAAEFWSDPVTLHPGENKFTIVATNRSQKKVEVTFVAHFSPPAPLPAPSTAAPTAAPAAAEAPNPKALSLQDILDLLKNFVPNERVATLVKQYGLKFSPTEEDLKKLEEAGADDGLLTSIRDAAKAAHLSSQ